MEFGAVRRDGECSRGEEARRGADLGAAKPPTYSGALRQPGSARALTRGQLPGTGGAAAIFLAAPVTALPVRRSGLGKGWRVGTAQLALARA